MSPEVFCVWYISTVSTVQHIVVQVHSDFWFPVCTGIVILMCLFYGTNPWVSTMLVGGN